jgi:hypothetical protein
VRSALKGTLPITLLFFLLSLISAAALQWSVSQGDPGLSIKENLSQGILNAFITFAACELAILLVQSERLRRLIERQDTLLQKVANRDKEMRCTADEVECILGAARGRNVPAHQAVAKALMTTVKNIAVQDDHLSVSGQQMAVASYRWFWEEILDAQRHNKKTGAEPISVFATHSASVEFWDSPEFLSILHTQCDFVRAGGALNRIFIDRLGIAEHRHDYERIIEEMRSYGADDENGGFSNIFYLKMSEKDPILDFLLTAFRRKHYVSEWNPRHFGSNNADIAACDFYVGRHKFEHVYWVKWRNAVELLERRARATGLPIAATSILDSGPTARQLREMRDFSDG